MRFNFIAILALCLQIFYCNGKDFPITARGPTARSFGRGMLFKRQNILSKEVVTCSEAPAAIGPYSHVSENFLIIK